MNEPVPEVGGDFIPLRVTYDRVPHVICVGHAGGGMAHVTVNGVRCAMTPEGFWASAPLPYAPGKTVKAVFVTARGKRRELQVDLPGPDKLGPVFGPDWTPFAPLE